MRKICWGTIAAFLGGSLLTACASLEVKKRPSDSAVIEGIPYSLPQKSYLISAKYTLLKCGVSKTDSKKIEFSVKKEISVAAVTRPDPDQRYFVPYNSLRSVFKDIDFSIENYDNQTLKSVNATVNDKTGETAVAVLGTAIRVATLVAGGALAAGGSAQALKDSDLCDDEVLQALDTSQKDGAASGTAAQTSSKNKAEKADAQKKTKKPEKESASASSKPKTGNSSDSDSPLVIQALFEWTPTLTDAAESQFRIAFYPYGLIGKWLKPQGSKLLTLSGDKTALVKRTVAGKEISEVILKSAQTEFLVKLPTKAKATVVSDPVPGLVLREPAVGILSVCDYLCPNSNELDGTGIISTSQEIIPQLGQIFVVPLKSGIFESQTLGVALSSDGGLSKVGLKSSAEAPAVVNAVNGAIDSGAKANTSISKARSDQKSAEENAGRDAAQRVQANNKAVADCLAAQQAVRDAGGSIVGACQ